MKGFLKQEYDPILPVWRCLHVRFPANQRSVGGVEVSHRAGWYRPGARYPRMTRVMTHMLWQGCIIWVWWGSLHLRSSVYSAHTQAWTHPWRTTWTHSTIATGEQPPLSFSEHFMLARYETDDVNRNGLILHVLILSGLSNDDVGVATATVFLEARPGADSKTSIFIEE